METEVLEKTMGLEYRPKKKVACVITTYNRSELLKRAVRSVMNQTLEDWELIVVDDGSTDNTLDTLMELMLACEGKMSYYQMSENSGRRLGKVRNVGIEKTNSEYVCFLDDDNEMEPEFMKELSGFLDKHSEVDMVYCDSMMYVNDTPAGVERSRDFDKEALKVGNYIDLGESMIRSSVFVKVGLFDDDIPSVGDDWVYWNRVAAKSCRIQHYPVALCKYYKHAGQTTHHPSHMEYFGLLRKKIEEAYKEV